MNYVILLGILCLSFHLISAPPPRRNEHEEKKQEKHENDDMEDIGLEYKRYLKEVVDLLESDPEFKRKLEDAQEADIRSGKIAQELEFVDHKVRTKLDEVKRQELERLRHLAQKQYELTNGIDTEHMKISSEHLDHENPHTFEMEDLKKLIAKVSADLVKADEKRRQEFKEYEMQKEFEKQEKLKHLEGSEKEAFEKQLKENETKHKQHEPLHHPGSKQQLEEVWEKQDHMDNQDFDPKVFFQLHDLDGNGVWDQNEVKTLFLKELDKMYEQGAPEDDMRERAEEMERMREHVFGEADKNRDGLISFEEFLEKTKQPDFEKDPGWESLDQKPVYTYEEYKEFERRRQEEVQRLVQQGLIPPQPMYPPEYGYHHPPQPSYGHPQQYQPHMQGHPQQMPQGYLNQHQQGYNQHQEHQQGYNQNQHQQGYNQNQHQQGYNQNQHQQGYNQNQHQQGYNQNQHQQEYNQNQHQQGYNQNQHQQEYNQNQHQQGYNQNQGSHQNSGYHNKDASHDYNQKQDNLQNLQHQQHPNQGQNQHESQQHPNQGQTQHESQQHPNQGQTHHESQQQNQAPQQQQNRNDQGSYQHHDQQQQEQKPNQQNQFGSHDSQQGHQGDSYLGKQGTFQKAHAELDHNVKDKNPVPQSVNNV